MYCEPYRYLKKFLREGDGTVPLPSAARQDENGVRDYNAPKATCYQVTSDDEKDSENRSHLELTQNRTSLQKVAEFLDNSVESIRPPRTTCDASGTQANALVAAAIPATHRLTFHNATEIVVRDAFGNSTPPISPAIDRAVPGVDILTLGERVESVTLPATQAYTLTFATGTGLGIGIELRTGTGSTITHTIHYKDLALPPQAKAQLVFSPQGIDLLRYDADGDGVFESSITPTVDVSGPQANDQEPPTIEMMQTTQGNHRLLTLTAQDAESGVQALYYSLDGTQFQVYTSPLLLDPAQTPDVYAFADDVVGNRSSEVRYALDTLQVTGSPASGAVTVTAPGRFQLVFDAAHKWQAGTWYDLASAEPTVNLARSDGPSLNYNVLQSPLELFFDWQWHNLDTAISPTLRIVSQNERMAVLETAWRWPTSAGGTLAVTATHHISVFGSWEVQTVLANETSQPWTFNGAALEYAFTNVTGARAWQETLAADESRFILSRADGPQPRSTLTVQRAFPVGSLATDGWPNRYWAVEDVALPVGGAWSIRWTNQLWPGQP